jgi:hypothetical protein
MPHQFWELVDLKIITSATSYTLFSYLFAHKKKRKVDKISPPHVNLQSLATGARRRSLPGFAATHDRGSSSLVAEARSHHHRGSPSPVVGALAARRQSSQSSVSSSSCWDSPPPYRLCPCHPRSSGSHHACGVRLKIT